MKDNRLRGPARDKAPCGTCTEKFKACHDHCPKDERGEYGYKAFLAEIEKVKEARRLYEMKYSKYFHDFKEEFKNV